jgi:protein-S-isoprenylcysteine O-methyltransferase Ste14
MKKPVTLIVIILLSMVAIAHLARLAFGVEVLIRGWVVPQWVSVPGFLIFAVLAVLLWRERSLPSRKS